MERMPWMPALEFPGRSAIGASALANRTRSPRVAIGGIAHETNTFSPVPTTVDNFRQRAFLSGSAIIERCAGSRNVLGGMMAGAATDGVELLPTLFAAAAPGGTVTAAAWRSLRDGLLDRLRTRLTGPWPVDGVLLALHGAMVCDDEPDAEGAILAAVRSLIGPDRSLVATLDSHANVSPAMIAAADLLLPYRTYPHLDPFERGQDALRQLVELRRGQRSPITAFRQLPLLTPLPPQRTTGESPMAEVMALARTFERIPGVDTVEIAGGFAYADVAGAGISLWVTSNEDRALAEELADRLAAAVWAQRDRFQTSGLAPDDAIDRVMAAGPGGGPIILAEVADNPGAGAAGNGTGLLACLVARGVHGAVLGALAAAETLVASWLAGEGAMVPFPLIDATGTSIATEARVLRLSDGCFTERGPMASGGPTRLGRTALLGIDGVEVVISERPARAIDPALFQSLGVEPRERRVVAVKSSVHFRAAFEPIASAIMEVETPGLSPSDLRTLPYRHVRRPIWPLDREVRYLD
jgi:microcystin degradation protein MlrC